MWFYLEIALLVVGFFCAYTIGWKNGWHAAFTVTKKAVAELVRQQAVDELRPNKRASEDKSIDNKP